ncbi:MAG: hypothetical protein IPJ82_11835 [Lewinellaceae bacterium]|nr:hypothetical protein [Lewinellaceae bacterium]
MKNCKIVANIFNCHFIDNITNSYYTTAISGGSISDILISFKSCEFLGNKNISNQDGLNFPVGAGVGGGESKCKVAFDNAFR